MFESSKLHCRLHCLGVEVTNGYRGHVFRLGPCFFFPFHKPNYYECAFFLAKPTTHARVVRHTILKRNGKKKPWAQTNNSLPNNQVRHNEASFNSTKWRCPYDNVTYCKFTPNRKQLPKQLPPPLHMARTWMDMHRLRRLHDSQYIMKNPFTNENSNLSNIFHNNIHRKKVESLKVRSTEEFLCQFAWLPCRFFRGRRQGRQPLINMSSLYEWQVISTLLLVPGFMKLNPKWQSKWTYRKSHKHFVVINQWIWGFQISRHPLSDNLTSTFCRAWIPAISAVWGEAISAVIGSPANRSHQVSLSCFGWFSETNRLCFAKSDGTASSCKRPEIHITHNITELRNYIVI